MRKKNSSLLGKTIGFIGLGLMGKPMARNLRAAGATLIIQNRSSGPIEELSAEGMKVAQTPAEIANQVDVIILMLTDSNAVENVVTGQEGLLKNLKADTILVDMGTTLMTKTREIAGKVALLGAHYIDAPVSGGTIGAKNGTLTIMAGGNKAAFTRIQPILEVIGTKITHVGEVGAGQITKSVNQIIVGLTIGAIAEGLSLARNAGVDINKVHEALEGGFAGSRVLQLHGKRMLDREFTPGAKSRTQRKDMDQAITIAAEFGLKLPATELNRELYDRVIDAGYGDLDHAALILAIDPDAI